MRWLSITLLTTLALAILGAHEGHHAHHNEATFAGGLGHPFTGLDHILAMLAVGLMAALYAGFWRWLLPLGFLVGLGLGGLVGALSGTTSAGMAVEMSVALSVLAFGVILTVGRGVSPKLALALVLLAALPHGYAHLSEAGGGALTNYGLGMLLGSAILHTAGLLGALAIAGGLSRRWQIVAGPAVALAGMVLSVLVLTAG